MNDSISPRPLPLWVRVRLWVLWRMEHLLLKVCPRGRFKRLSLAWIDRRYAEVRERDERRASGTLLPGD